jgi:hypothetical protein
LCVIDISDFKTILISLTFSTVYNLITTILDGEIFSYDYIIQHEILLTISYVCFYLWVIILLKTDTHIYVDIFLSIRFHFSFLHTSHVQDNIQEKPTVMHSSPFELFRHIPRTLVLNHLNIFSRKEKKTPCTILLTISYGVTHIIKQILPI